MKKRNNVTKEPEIQENIYRKHSQDFIYLIACALKGASPDKLRELAHIAFAGEYPAEVLNETLAKFLKRFAASQYKRDCVPDGPKITLSLSPRADWRMPSDI